MSKSQLKRLAIQCPEVQALLEQVEILKKSLSLTLDAEEKLEEENARLREALQKIVSVSGTSTEHYWIAKNALGEK